MSHRPDSHFEQRFELLMELADQGRGEEVFADLLKIGPSDLFNPLSSFLIKKQTDPRIRALIDLLAKLDDVRSISILMRFLDIENVEIQKAAVIALGWQRARVALEKLDEIEGSHPDPGLKFEARLAIEEILIQYPNLRNQLHHHSPVDEPRQSLPSEHDVVPRHPDSQQKLKLIGLLPRILANKFLAVPLHLSPNKMMHLAVVSGSEKRLIPILAEVTGHHVELRGWSKGKIHQTIEALYTLGDDDFRQLYDDLTDFAKLEIKESILEGVHPQEPTCPLSETNDSIEALQCFLSCCLRLKTKKAFIQVEPPKMTLSLEIENSETVSLDPPDMAHQEKFMNALKLLAGLNPAAGLGSQAGGVIKILLQDMRFLLHLENRKTLTDDTIEINFDDYYED